MGGHKERNRRRSAVGLEARNKGAKAEQRVAEMAQNLGLPIARGPDYQGKADFYVNGDVPVQVSVDRKSKRTLRGLRRRGVFPIVAGPQVSDGELEEQLLSLISNK